jgi:hypothetical protein
VLAVALDLHPESRAKQGCPDYGESTPDPSDATITDSAACMIVIAAPPSRERALSRFEKRC